MLEIFHFTSVEWAILGLSLKVALLCVVMIFIPAVATAWLLARKSFIGKSLLDSLIHLPLVLPPVVPGFLLLLLLGNQGLIGKYLHTYFGFNLAFTWKGAAVASAVMAFPLMVRSCRLAFSQFSNRSSATNWAIGMTCVWTLLMTLWLPLIDSARSYRNVFSDLAKALPEKYACVKSQGLGASQRDLLHYYTKIITLPFESEQSLNCDLYLIEDEKDEQLVVLGNNWKLIWTGKRVAERSESFRLFQYH